MANVNGYQAAVLSPLVEAVYTIEIVDSLGHRASRLLKRLKYDNVHVRVGDGFKGWCLQADATQGSRDDVA